VKFKQMVNNMNHFTLQENYPPRKDKWHQLGAPNHTNPSHSYG